MRKYISIPTKDLASDVPVDTVHVRELADSIKASGPISPVLVREENLQLIDGFHRMAAMKELGFENVECILTSCDDETFWDLRIMSATLHKAVTFARAIDWIEECFKTSPFGGRYESAYSLFRHLRDGTAGKEAETWAQEKATKWGLAPATIESWLYTKQSIAPDLFTEAKSVIAGDDTVSRSHYIEVATSLPGRFDLQRQVVDKAKREGLTRDQVREVTQALKRTEDKEEVHSILKQSISRTEDQMVRDAKVEKLLSHPREITPLEKWQEAKHEDVLYKLDLLGIINSTRAMTQEKIDALTPEQKADVYHTCEEAITEIRRVMDMTRPTIRAEYQLK